MYIVKNSLYFLNLINNNNNYELLLCKYKYRQPPKRETMSGPSRNKRPWSGVCAVSFPTTHCSTPFFSSTRPGGSSDHLPRLLVRGSPSLNTILVRALFILIAPIVNFSYLLAYRYIFF